MYLQTQSIYNGQRSIYNYNGEKNVKSVRIVHYFISCICVCVYMCICVFVHLCTCVFVHLCTWPTSRVANSWSPLNWLHNSAQSLICFQPTSSSQLHLPHVFRRDHLLLARGGSHHHSGSVQPGSLCVKQFGQASLSACISSLAGIDRVWGLRPAVTCQLELKGTCGYLKVLRGTCGHFLNHVHVCVCVWGIDRGEFRVRGDRPFATWCLSTATQSFNCSLHRKQEGNAGTV